MGQALDGVGGRVMEGQGEGRIGGVMAAGRELHDTSSEHVVPANVMEV